MAVFALRTKDPSQYFCGDAPRPSVDFEEDGIYKTLAPYLEIRGELRVCPYDGGEIAGGDLEILRQELLQAKAAFAQKESVWEHTFDTISFDPKTEEKSPVTLRWTIVNEQLLRVTTGLIDLATEALAADETLLFIGD